MHRLGALVVTVSLLAAGCGSDAAWSQSSVVAEREAVSLASLPDGTVLYAVRSGQVYSEAADEPLASFAVTTQGQRGLLGLTTLDDRVFVAYTRPDTQMVVEEIVEGGEAARVWTGVLTPGGGLGGRLATHDGQLLLGLGNGADTEAFGQSGGALVLLDPDGPAEQEPEVLSSGWNNPFAFAVTPGGQVWVADNDPADDAERLARADGADVVIELPSVTAPSGLTAISDTELWLCSYTTQRLDRYRIDDEGIPERAGTVANDCWFDVHRISDDRVAYATESLVLALTRG